jgi:hypothetical protein
VVEERERAGDRDARLDVVLARDADELAQKRRQCSGGVGRRPSNATFQAAMSGVMLANGTSCDTISHINRPNE